jgi:hypothetical protein
MDKRDRNLVLEFKKRLPLDVMTHIRAEGFSFYKNIEREGITL